MAQSSIENTLMRFSQAWHQKDVDTVVGCFSERAVYYASVGPLPGEKAVGRVHIHDLITRMFSHDDGAVSITEDLAIGKNSATWKWRYELPDGSSEIGCDFFTFEGSLIALKDAYRKVKTENSE
ncbi:MAG: nuclear transport factor 2 family protein [Hellea sp.]